MNPEQLMYYLKGFAEPASEPPTREQWGVIRAHILGASDTGPQIFSGGFAPPEFLRTLEHGCSDCGTPKPGGPIPPTSIEGSKL